MPAPSNDTLGLPTHSPLPRSESERTVSRSLPELLAPAGDWDCARAAVENGADAIYFGLERFNARMRAQNFTESDLPRLMAFLHGRGVKGYVTLNTLIFQDELAEAERFLRAMILAGVDAVIVQDIGVCRLIRQLSRDFPIHASTQMTVTSAAGLALARELGCELVVLARECSLAEIARIQAEQRQDARPLPLEVFVHGALCVAYSGQCLTSEALGGRSANRGECAQACRMPYELISDGHKVPLGDRRYLLSPQDLAGLELLPELAAAGVASLKIEGRLKSPEYVANITRVYRQALDSLVASWSQPSASPDATPLAPPAGSRAAPDPATRYQLEMAFSRGLFTGWFNGIDNQNLVHARFGKKRGAYLGEVTRVLPNRVQARIAGAVKPGDGLVFDAGRPDEPEEGGRVYTVDQQGRETVLGFGQGDIDFRRLQVGDRIWKTSDPELDRRLRETFTAQTPQFQRPVQLEVHGRIGASLRLLARDELGHAVEVVSRMPLARADSQPLTRARLKQQLGRLGGTPFRLGELHVDLEDPSILPVSELNRLRRAWVTRLEELRTTPKRWDLCPGKTRLTPAPAALTAAAEASPALASRAPELSVLVRSLEQLEAVLPLRLGIVYCEFEDPKKYREAVRLFRASSDALAPSGPPALFVAPPRVSKSGEDWILKQVRSADADGYLIRNYDHLRFFAGTRCIADYSFNVANALTAEFFKARFSLERLTASYDLNPAQLEALLSATPPDWLEITIHQHMPMFHMEHCVFCAFLSSGTDYTNCGRPCDHHQVQLQDRVGARHPIKADAGCRNTVFNARAQTGAEAVARLRKAGARFFRIEFLDELPAQVVQTVASYQALLAGRVTGQQLWQTLKLLNQLGVTRGSPEPR